MSALFYVAIAASLALVDAAPSASKTLREAISTAGDGWTVIRSDGLCAVERAGLAIDPGVAVRLALRPTADRAALQLVRKADTRAEVGAQPSLVLDGSAPIASQGLTEIVEPYNGQRVTSVWMLRPDLERLLAAKSIVVTAGSETDIRLASPGLIAGDLLQACERESMIEWGVPAAAYDAVATPSQLSPMQYFTTSDYPDTSIRNEEAGTVGAVAQIDPAGIVRSCRVVSSSGFAALDLKTCEVLLLRGRAKPARDHRGNPVTGFDFFSIRWELPGE